MTAQPLSSTAKAGSVPTSGSPNKPLPEAGKPRTVYSIATVKTPKRDVDLFGETTVRIDGALQPDGAPVPMLYLSPYARDAERLARRIIAGLAYADDTQDLHSAEPAPVYTMPDFVEDVDYAAALFLPEDLTQADWPSWSEALLRRIRLAVNARQLADLERANNAGIEQAPQRIRAKLGRALESTYEDVGQGA